MAVNSLSMTSLDVDKVYIKTHSSLRASSKLHRAREVNQRQGFNFLPLDDIRIDIPMKFIEAQYVLLQCHACHGLVLFTQGFP